MMMFIFHEDGTNFFDLNVSQEKFKIGEIIEIESLNGKYVVAHLDACTVIVKPI